MNGDTLLNEEALHIIREVEENPALNQRILAQKLNVSLGKTNYLLRTLIRKGMIKAKNFSKNPKKAKKLQYILTPKGINEKINLTLHYLQKKEKEYKRLKEEYDKYVNGRT